MKRTPAGWTWQGKAAVFPGGHLGIRSRWEPASAFRIPADMGWVLNSIPDLSCTFRLLQPGMRVAADKPREGQFHFPPFPSRLRCCGR